MAEQHYDVAVLGCGIMGSAIARRARRSGLRTVAWDRLIERARAVGEGVEATPDLQAAAGSAAVVVTMLADAGATLSVMDAHHGFDAMKSGSTWVQMATIGLKGIMKARLVASQRSDIVFVDAPVSGTKQPAEEGKLLILASCDRQDVPEPVQRLFRTIGQRTIWLGEVGEGTRMKLVLNSWLASIMEALVETLAVADVLGVPHERFAECIEGGPLGTPWAIAKAKKIDSGKTNETEFPLKWADKDVHLALEAVKETAHDRELPALEAIQTFWDRAVASNLGNRDVSAVYEALTPAASAK